jgi:hypothetical protein
MKHRITFCCVALLSPLKAQINLLLSEDLD